MYSVKLFNIKYIVKQLQTLLAERNSTELYNMT